MGMDERVRVLNAAPVRKDARYLLYWAQVNRRVESNHALAHAAELANELDLPLLYYEGLTCSYPYASNRLHTFILEGVPGTEKRLRELGAGYVFYLRRKRADPNDVLYRLAAEAAAVVTDDYPVFIAARHNLSVPPKLPVAYHVVDSSCIVPMSRFEKREYAARTIRPKIQRLLPRYLRAVAPLVLRRRFRGPVPSFHTRVNADNLRELAASCQIDHDVPPSVSFRGGRAAAEATLEHFLEDKLRHYSAKRNDPVAHATSGLSPYLHFGQISSLEVALRVEEYASKHGLMAGEFLEELIVRRELAFNFARHAGAGCSLDQLPDWARRTLGKHRRDQRSPLYTREELERAATHDPLWNATQKEMLLRGKIHGYYRMYWGKKIIEWSESPEAALETMVHIHDRYALDGRDPNTYTNILWCLGLHDRPWAERPVFGTVRYMSLEGMKRKTNVPGYIEEIEEMERTGRDPFLIQ